VDPPISSVTGLRARTATFASSCASGVMTIPLSDPRDASGTVWLRVACGKMAVAVGVGAAAPDCTGPPATISPVVVAPAAAEINALVAMTSPRSPTISST
jgi:hypothetical protein